MPNADEQTPRLRDDGTPYYVQLSTVIRRQIADEIWNVGDRLPTLKHLVATYGVSPMTVRHALAGLEKEGLISAKRGRGTFVIAKPEMAASTPHMLTRLPSQRGGQLSFRVLASRPAAGELRITPEDGDLLGEYRYIKRLFSRDGGPFTVGEYLIAQEIYDLVPEKQWGDELISALLYDTREADLAKVRQTFRVISSMPQEAAQLGIQVHDPVVQVRRVFRNSRKQVICLAQLVYRTDGVVFDINVDIDDRDRLLELGGIPEARVAPES